MSEKSGPAILVVDDEEPILRLVRTLLNLKPYRVRCASNANEALALMEEEPVDVLLTDHMMPGGTGLDLIDRANSLYPETVKILLTGVGDRDLYREAINRGAVFSLIEKPFHNQHLLDTVEKAIDHRYSHLREKQEMQRLRDQYHAIFDHTTDLIQSTDSHGRFVYVNPAWHHSLGYMEEHLSALSIEDTIHPSWRTRFTEIVDRVKAGRKVKTFETVMIARNGSLIYLEGNVIGKYHDGETAAVSCMFRDVTERKRFTEELQARLRQETMIARIADLLARSEEPEAMYGDILTIVAESVAVDNAFIFALDDITHSFTPVVSWNRPGMPSLDGIFSAVRYKDVPRFTSQIRDGNTISVNTMSPLREPDRTFFMSMGVISLLAFPIAIGSCVVGVLAFMTSDSTREWEEAEIGMLKAASDIIANAWTRQMEINVRRQKESEAEQSRLLVIRADRLAALGTMVAGIIHEITQPLNAINVSTQTILYGLSRGWKIDGEKAVNSLNLVVEQVKRMTDIITNMRAFARDGLPAARDKDNVNTQVTRVFTMLGEQMKAHNIEVDFRFGDIPDIWMNTQQILQVILNLVTNARQALDDIEGGDRRIAISTHAEEDYIVLEISDTGPGIPDSIKEKVFDPFFTTKEVGRGTGLGLSITMSIIQDHGGHIHVRTNEAGGTTFIIRLPIKP